MLRLVVLDLDETLVYASIEGIPKPHFTISDYSVLVRPYAKELITHIHNTYELAFWTSAGEDYGRAVVAGLGISENIPKFVWTSSKCTRRFDRDSGEYFQLKDLKKVKRLGYDLSQVIMVDDTPQKVSKNYGNHVRVSEWLGNEKDDELLFLMGYLDSIRDHEDLRKIEKRGWLKNFRSDT
jgi:TFIIF-interacting CTD phosphatase-like protein